jgi:hypothetical protein
MPYATAFRTPATLGRCHEALSWLSTQFLMATVMLAVGTRIGLCEYDKLKYTPGVRFMYECPGRCKGKTVTMNVPEDGSWPACPNCGELRMTPLRRAEPSN